MHLILLFSISHHMAVCTFLTGVIKEAHQWVEPLHSNEALRRAFIDFTAPPLTYHKLEKLSKYVIMHCSSS